MACRRNIEIKAKIADKNEFHEKISIAKKLTNSDGKILLQHDVFFTVKNGRLKLRYEDDSCKLVQYSRPDVPGPKLSQFNILEISGGPLMEQMLTESLGVLGVLDKTRYLFMHEGRTRIHLDIVKNTKGSSDYYAMEFEVMMKPEEEISLGNQISEGLMKIFQLKSDQLLEGSYFETLNN